MVHAQHHPEKKTETPLSQFLDNRENNLISTDSLMRCAVTIQRTELCENYMDAVIHYETLHTAERD